MRLLPIAAACLATTTLSLYAADPPATLPAEGAATRLAATHDAMVKMYLDGKWEDLEGMLAVIRDGLLPDSQKAENFIIRAAMNECRPAWWKTAKAGKPCTFQAVVWGRTLNTSFDPAKTDMTLSLTNGHPSITLGWTVSEMDSPANAEHGFSKGELLDLGIWNTFGMADAWGNIPLASQSNLDETGKLRLNRYLDFRGDVAGVYYGSPRARRWGLWLYLAMYMDKYRDMQIVASRRAVGIMLMTEVIAHPEKYPSMKLPVDWKETSESKIADRLRLWLEKNQLPLAEDKALRDAVKAFAAANEISAFKSGQVVLPNKLVANFDPKVDEPLRVKREAWIKEQLAKPPATAPAK